MEGSRSRMTPQETAERSISSLGCGFDLTDDIYFSCVKSSRLVHLAAESSSDLVVPGGILVHGVPSSVKCDKGERIRFRSDVLSFNQMSEQFNRRLSLSGKIPSGYFNSSFDFHGCWMKDSNETETLCYDGLFVELYRLELEKSSIQLLDLVKQDVPSSWDPSSLSRFIEKYGTHVIAGVQIGGSDVVHLKQLRGSTLLPCEVQLLLKAMADKRFSEDSTPVRLPVMLKNKVVRIHVIKGGRDEFSQSHNDWMPTVYDAPALLSLSLVPITSLLNGVNGSGFLSHAINLYLRYKPPVKELAHFLEFQLPREWAPAAFNELPFERRKESFPSLKIHWMGPKIYLNTIPVESGNRPVTGMRLCLEGEKNDRLAVHLQHLTSLPSFLRLTGDEFVSGDDEEGDRHVPVQWARQFHVCTCPVQHRPSGMEETAHVVTKAALEVKEVGPARVLFLRLGFSAFSGRIRNSQWGPAAGGIVKRVSVAESLKELNSGVFADGPFGSLHSRLSAPIDTSEMVRGPEEPPGYWIVTGAKLCVDRGRVSLRVKYSVLSTGNLEDQAENFKARGKEKD